MEPPWAKELDFAESILRAGADEVNAQISAPEGGAPGGVVKLSPGFATLFSVLFKSGVGIPPERRVRLLESLASLIRPECNSRWKATVAAATLLHSDAARKLSKQLAPLLPAFVDGTLANLSTAAVQRAGSSRFFCYLLLSVIHYRWIDLTIEPNGPDNWTGWEKKVGPAVMKAARWSEDAAKLDSIPRVRALAKQVDKMKDEAKSAFYAARTRKEILAAAFQGRHEQAAAGVGSGVGRISNVFSVGVVAMAINASSQGNSELALVALVCLVVVQVVRVFAQSCLAARAVAKEQGGDGVIRPGLDPAFKELLQESPNGQGAFDAARALMDSSGGVFVEDGGRIWKSPLYEVLLSPKTHYGSAEELLSSLNTRGGPVASAIVEKSSVPRLNPDPMFSPGVTTTPSQPLPDTPADAEVFTPVPGTPQERLAQAARRLQTPDPISSAEDSAPGSPVRGVQEVPDHVLSEYVYKPQEDDGDDLDKKAEATDVFHPQADNEDEEDEEEDEDEEDDDDDDDDDDKSSQSSAGSQGPSRKRPVLADALHDSGAGVFDSGAGVGGGGGSDGEEEEGSLPVDPLLAAAVGGEEPEMDESSARKTISEVLAALGQESLEPQVGEDGSINIPVPADILKHAVELRSILSESGSPLPPVLQDLSWLPAAPGGPVPTTTTSAPESRDQEVHDDPSPPATPTTQLGRKRAAAAAESEAKYVYKDGGDGGEEGVDEHDGDGPVPEGRMMGKIGMVSSPSRVSHGGGLKDVMALEEEAAAEPEEEEEVTEEDLKALKSLADAHRGSLSKAIPALARFETEALEEKPDLGPLLGRNLAEEEAGLEDTDDDGEDGEKKEAEPGVDDGKGAEGVGGDDE